MRHILSFLKPYRRKIALAMVLVAFATVCDLLLPTLMSDILNNGIRGRDFPYIVSRCCMMLLVAALGLTTLIFGRRLSAEVVAGFNGDLRTETFQLVNRMTFEEFNMLGTAALVTRSTHDISTVSWVASIVSGSLITIPVLFVGGVALAMRKDVVLSLILLAFVPLVLAVVLLVGKNITPLHQKSDRYIDIQNNLMRERLHGIRVIRAFNREAQQQERIADATRVMAENIINANVRMGLISPVAVFLLNVAALLIVWAGGVRMEQSVSAVSGGDIFAILQYISLVANGLLMAGFAIVMLPHARVAADRIGEIFQAKGMDEPNPEERRVFAGGIAFEHVTFRYDNAAEPAIQDVSLKIEPGQKVAIIGGTGSGKSTLLQLLMAFRLPTEGRILFDGVPSETINRRVIRDNISCVLQRTAVYSGTIRHNIEMGRPDASEEEICEAAAIAQLSDFIQSLPEGLDHVLTQSGKNLSGGQKQRLCIARAILKDAPIYAFDDSFSALDFLTEANLRRQLNEKIRGKTQIVITQRITSAMSADQIFVMDRGCLIDSGTHEALLERCSVYREIYASQTGGDRL